MRYDVNFGRLGGAPGRAAPGQSFRLAVLGDFSGRANAGTLDLAGLGGRKPLRVDADTLDDVIARLKPTLRLELDAEAGALSVPIASLDDFHPDALVDNLEIFSELRDLRRNLGSKAGFDRAAKEVLSWEGELPLPPPPRRSAAAVVATDRRISDFARLTGRQPPAPPSGDVEDLVRRLVGPYVVAARDARQEALVARVDEALSAAMRRVLHHADFQAMEAAWRGVDFLVRRIETGARAEIVLYDVSAEEFAADLAAHEALDETGLYSLLVEAPSLDAQSGAFGAIVALYGFELSPPHADLLGRAAQIAAAAGAPLIAGIGAAALSVRRDEQNPLIQQAWTALEALPAAAYLGLATPRFLLRMPYGRKSDPIDAFPFEEFTRESGLSGMLWGHPALLAGFLLAETFRQSGSKMKLGSVAGIGEMPYYVYVDADGDQVALPCTERLFTERQAAQVSTYHVMPVVSLRGRPEIRLGSFGSLAGRPLAGFWAPVEVSAGAAPAPEPAAAEPSEPPASEGPAVEEATVAAAPAPAAADDLDALLASLETPSAKAPEATPADAPPADDLDALLASLSTDAPPTTPGETESDLDALLASLKS